MPGSEFPDGVTADTPCYAVVFRASAAGEDSESWFFEIAPVDGHLETIDSGQAGSKDEAKALCRRRIKELGLSQVTFRARSK